MPQEYLLIAAPLGAAWLAGSLIGLERSFHGRPAGFRTHALVCVASALLMQVTTHQREWLGAAPIDTIRTDPTRMAQGIMTGIGFLGAGVIFREGLTVRGLTTAASIWITAAIGILFGVAFYFPAIAATAATLATLSAFRWVESRMPSQTYAHFQVSFPRQDTGADAGLRETLARHGCSIANMSYRLDDGGRSFEYRMVLKTSRAESLETLAQELRNQPHIVEFRLSRSGD